MRRLAERLGVKAPSLYKHLDGKEELEAALIAVGLEDVSSVLAGAARASATDPLAAIARAYREFARARPHLYRLITERPLPATAYRQGSRPEPRLRSSKPPAARTVPGRSGHSRTAWSISSCSSRFPPGADLDAAWREGIAAFGTAAPPAPPARTVRAVASRPRLDRGLPRALARPAIGDRQPPVAAERLRPELHARRRLAALVLGAVDERDCPLDDVRVEAVRRELLLERSSST